MCGNKCTFLYVVYQMYTMIGYICRQPEIPKCTNYVISFSCCIKSTNKTENYNIIFEIEQLNI